MKERRIQLLLNIAILLCLGAAIILRFVDLDNIPGLNGDDAWLATQIRNLIAGRAYTIETPTHRWVAPTYIFAQGLFQLLPWTNIIVLKMPIALASVAGVLAIPLLFQKILSRTELAIATLIVACMPIHVAYARSLGELSQVGLAMAVVMALVYRGRILWALMALALASTIHPTCMLGVPIVICGCAAGLEPAKA